MIVIVFHGFHFELPINRLGVCLIREISNCNFTGPYSTIFVWEFKFHRCLIFLWKLIWIVIQLRSYVLLHQWEHNLQVIQKYNNCNILRSLSYYFRRTSFTYSETADIRWSMWDNSFQCCIQLNKSTLTTMWTTWIR